MFERTIRTIIHLVHHQGLVPGQREDVPVNHLHCLHGLGVTAVASQVVDILPVILWVRTLGDWGTLCVKIALNVKKSINH